MRTGQEGGPFRIFMLGWEFPPFISGGLGTACYGLTKAMDQLGMHVTFVLPKLVTSQYAGHVKLLTPGSLISHVYSHGELKNVKFYAIPSGLIPYSTPQGYSKRIEDVLRTKAGMRGVSSLVSQPIIDAIHYGNDMHGEVHRYAAIAAASL